MKRVRSTSRGRLDGGGLVYHQEPAELRVNVHEFPFSFFFWMNVRKDLRFQDPPGKCEHILSRQRHIFVDGFSMGFPD